jgi:hypothetical protein
VVVYLLHVAHGVVAPHCFCQFVEAGIILLIVAFLYVLIRLCQLLTGSNIMVLLLLHYKLRLMLGLLLFMFAH